jgi:hypothetical protein
LALEKSADQNKSSGMTPEFLNFHNLFKQHDFETEDYVDQQANSGRLCIFFSNQTN